MSNIRMPDKFKSAWSAALRSGEYKQGDGYLFNPNDNSYCCLGVLCCVLGEDKDVLVHQEIPDIGVMQMYGVENIEDYLLPLDAEMHGFDRLKFGACVRHGKTSFVMLNDTFGLSFAQIADLIDKHVEGY